MGGALRHLTNLLHALGNAPGGHRYDVLVRESAPIACDCDRIRIIRMKDAHAQSALHRTFADLILSAARARGYDVLVSLLNFGPILCPIPHVLFQCNALYFSRRYRASLDAAARMELTIRRRWTVEAMRFAETIVTPSRAMTDLILADAPFLKGKRFRTLYHGFDAATLGLEQNPDRRMAGWAYPKLLCASHLARYKNYEVLLRTLALLKGEYPDIQLFLTFNRADHAGDFEHYRRMAEEFCVAGHVTFVGRVGQQEIGGLYRAADVFLFPSLCESFGFPLLEAMGCGLPIAASDMAVHRELCKGAALYFDAEDARACAHAIRAIVEDRGCARALIREAADVLASFDWSWRRYAREFTEAIEDAALRRAA